MEPRGRKRHRRAAREGERAGANESNALQKINYSRQFAAQLCSAPSSCSPAEFWRSALIQIRLGYNVYAERVRISSSQPRLIFM